jgi:TPP-dependent pyruvate/acetoin dehydrogenase alpha subunit
LKKEIFKEVDKELEESKKDIWPDISELSADIYVKKLEHCRGLVPWHKVDN